jgi:hypothetical protein
MPYIKQDRREEVSLLIGPLADRADTPGELNFQLTEIVKRYWDGRKNYQAINDIVGALEGAKLEFYRRVAAPYEDSKIAENGDVY